MVLCANLSRHAFLSTRSIEIVPGSARLFRANTMSVRAIRKTGRLEQPITNRQISRTEPVQYMGRKEGAGVAARRGSEMRCHGWAGDGPLRL